MTTSTSTRSPFSKTTPVSVNLATFDLTISVPLRMRFAMSSFTIGCLKQQKVVGTMSMSRKKLNRFLQIGCTCYCCCTTARVSHQEVRSWATNTNYLYTALVAMKICSCQCMFVLRHCFLFTVLKCGLYILVFRCCSKIAGSCFERHVSKTGSVKVSCYGNPKVIVTVLVPTASSASKHEPRLHWNQHRCNDRLPRVSTQQVLKVSWRRLTKTG